MNKYFAQPYNLSATGFYFSNYSEYLAKSEDLTDCYGSTVEEFELQFIDGDDAELFSACGINQANLEFWFDSVETLDESEKAAVFFQCSSISKSLDQALDGRAEVSLYQGQLKDVAAELFDEIYLDSVPESVRNYIDYDAFARDCELGGDMTEFDFAGQTWTCTNANGL